MKNITRIGCGYQVLISYLRLIFHSIGGLIYLMIAIEIYTTTKQLEFSTSSQSLTLEESKIILLHSPLISFTGVCLGIFIKKILCELCANDLKIKLLSKTNIIVSVILIGIIVTSIQNTYPYMHIIDAHNFDAFTILLGISFFAAGFVVRVNPLDKFVLDDARVKISSFKLKNTIVCVDRQNYKCINNCLSIVYFSVVLGVIITHLSYKGILF